MGLYFDDVNAALGDLMQGRDAAQKFVATSLQASDRVGVFTASGQGNLDFTDDREKLGVALGNVKPRPITAGSGQACPNIDAYQAYQIVDMNNSEAIKPPRWTPCIAFMPTILNISLWPSLRPWRRRKHREATPKPKLPIPPAASIN